MKATQNPPAEVHVTPADTLRFAALYIERHGWHQGDYHPTTGNPFPPACAAAAIGIAVAGHRVTHVRDLDPDTCRDYLAAFNALVDYLDDINPSIVWDDPGISEHVSPYSWNDAPDRTAAQVTATLRAAADTWDHTNPGGAR
ncbi:DUF6197 family protein [Micromonospora sp. CPCC 206060]|uniref:DUF6197 family protein n=1 Tax=Micromonospora sp. CPCC 206060 TaxID=3122406 RepID=UPI002FEEF606